MDDIGLIICLNIINILLTIWLWIYITILETRERK